MPVHCYKNPTTTEIKNVFFGLGEAPEEHEIDGVVHTRCRAAEWHSQSGPAPSCWPMASNALAVHKTQRKEYSEFSIRNGVPTEFNERGQPVFTDRKHRSRYLNLVGATDFDAGYGDHVHNDHHPESRHAHP